MESNADDRVVQAISFATAAVAPPPVVKATAKRMLYRAGLFDVIDRLPPIGAVVLFFHKVQRVGRGLWGEPALSVEAFEEQVSYLTRNFEPVSLSTIVAALKGEARLPERAVAITFDDGYRNNLRLAAPVLKRYRVPATLFVTTGLVGTASWMWAYELDTILFRHGARAVAEASGSTRLQAIGDRRLPENVAAMAFVAYLKQLPASELHRIMDRVRARYPVDVDEENRFLSWDEVSELRGYGFELGAHTVTHPILPRVSLEEAEREIAQSREDLERHTGIRPTLFAYPNGDTTPEITRIAGKYFEAAVTDKPATCARGTPLLTLPRVYGPERHEDLASGLLHMHVRPMVQRLAQRGKNLIVPNGRAPFAAGDGGDHD